MPPIPWNEIWPIVLTLAGGIVTLSAAGSAVFKLFSPYKRFVKRLDGHDQALARDLKRFEEHEALHKKEQEQREADRADIAVLMKSQLALLSQTRVDDPDGFVRTAIEEIQQHLIDR